MLRVATVAVLLATVGCTDTADLFPMNEAAQQIGVPRMEFRRGLPRGPIKITMPDGEVLVGSFQVAQQGAIVSAFGAGGSATASATSGGGNFYAAATGPKTSIVCRGNVSFGHGGGECRTIQGAVYQVQV